MRTATWLATTLVLVMTSLVYAQEIQAEKLEKLDTAIPEGIRLLEAKEYGLFFKSFVPPSLLKKITKETSLEEAAQQFGEQKSARVLSVLKEIKEAKPTLNEDETKATYALKEAIGSKKSITFVKIDKRWYIEN